MAWIFGDQQKSKKKLKALMEEVREEFSEEDARLVQEFRDVKQIFDEYMRLESRINQVIDFPDPIALPTLEQVEDIKRKISAIKHEDQTIRNILSKIESGLTRQQLFLKRIEEEKSKSGRKAA